MVIRGENVIEGHSRPWPLGQFSYRCLATPWLSPCTQSNTLFAHTWRAHLSLLCCNTLFTSYCTLGSQEVRKKLPNQESTQFGSLLHFSFIKTKKKRADGKYTRGNVCFKSKIAATQKKRHTHNIGSIVCMLNVVTVTIHKSKWPLTMKLSWSSSLVSCGHRNFVLSWS